MHERSLVNDLVHRVEAVATGAGVDSVLSVRVRLGALAHLSPEHLAGHFHTAAAGTLAEGADLVVEQDDDIGAIDAMDLRLISVDVAEG